jgi:hypothetical protein
MCIGTAASTGGCSRGTSTQSGFKGATVVPLHIPASLLLVVMVMMITEGRSGYSINNEPRSVVGTESVTVRFANLEEDPSGTMVVISSSSCEKVLLLSNLGIHIQGPYGNSSSSRHEVWSSRLVGRRPLLSQPSSIRPVFRLAISFPLSLGSFVEPESAPLVSRQRKKGKIRKTKVDLNEID